MSKYIQIRILSQVSIKILTSRIEWHLKYRLSVLNRYTIAGFFYWDEAQNKFAAREGYPKYFVYTIHFAGYLACSILAAYVCFLLNPNEILDQVGQDSSSYSKHLLTIVCILDLLMIYGLLMIVSSSEIDHLSEVVASFNQGFNLNETLRKILTPDRQLPQDQNQLLQNTLIKCVCYFSYIIPIVFAANILHPADPVHNLVKDILEVDIEFSFLIVGFIMPLEAYGAICIVHHAIVGALQCLVDIFFG